MAIITKKTALLGVLALAGIMAVVKFVWKPTESEEQMKASSTQSQTPARETVMERKLSPEQAVKSVRVETSYKNPSGSDGVAFVLSVDADGKITAATTEVLAVNATSKMRQTAFAEALPAVLVGKDLKTLTSIDRVGGSSLTTKAFNDSLSQLQSQI